MKKYIPLWIKCPVALLLQQIGRMPFSLVWQHVRCSYAETRPLPRNKKEKRYQKSHAVSYRYLKKKYGAFLAERQSRYSQGEQEQNFPIWIMWWQGEEKAPEIVKTCIQSIRKHANGHPVHIIHSENYQDFIQLEPVIMDQVRSGVISLTHFSDIIRMNLLAEHGGFWVDSTIFCTREISGEAFDRPIFTIRNPGASKRNISRCEWTGFAMYGWKGGKLFCLMRDFFNRYWQEHDCLVEYFLIDFGIRLIYDTCPDVREQICRIPVNNQHWDYLQDHFREAYGGSLSDLDTGDTWLYKLTWKCDYPMVTQNGDRTLYAAWCEETM